ncbi:MAG TPA: flagellar hook protein FlgE [Bryobacteraceae bacterium]|jgi:flagellar hook protein FlgE|nr:flagellar hook protein FlgE [Bryobacteraceae bacterium]
MFTSFSTALSALNAFSTGIDVVGNNLANLDTSGFKASSVSFYDLVTQSLGAGLGETQVGFGVGAPITQRGFSQGAIQTTSGPLDAAISGDGFFIVRDPNNGSTQYTRSGSFQVDLSGNLTTATGQLVQGWTNQNGVLDTNSAPGAINVPTGTLKPPVATQNFSLTMNLNSAPSGSQPNTYSTSLQVYDSLGTPHTVTAQFTESSTPGQWDYSISVPGADLTSGSYTPVTGSLTFDSNGILTSPAPTDPSPQIQITGLADGATDMTLNWNLYNNGSPQVTQFAQASSVSALYQDGSAAAQLSHVGIANGGKIVAQYSDGTQTIVGQLAMATIRNPESLIAIGNSNFQLSAASALPAVGVPGTGGRGAVLGGSIESSTADIAKEFTNLIVLQRGYEANAKVVTTVDQVSQDTIALKQ